MSSTMNWASLLPGRNPSGQLTSADYSISGGMGSSTGANPIISPANMSQGSTQVNPYAPGSVTPTPVPSYPANQGPYSSTSLTTSSSPTTSLSTAQSGPLGAIFSGETPEGIKQLFSNLSKALGPGVGNLLANFLESGAGFNQQAINNLFAALQPGITAGTESIADQFSALGDRFGSDASIGLSNYLSQVNLNEGQIESSMYEQSVNDFINTLMGVSSKTSSLPTGLDTILQGIGLGSSGAQGLSSIISAISPNADTGILDAIGSLGASL